MLACEQKFATDGAGNQDNTASAIESTSESDRPVRTFMGYVCTEDCSGHQAGYDWAEEKGIEDPNDCGGNSESFIEGCRAYAAVVRRHRGRRECQRQPLLAHRDDGYREKCTGAKRSTIRASDLKGR